MSFQLNTRANHRQMLATDLSLWEQLKEDWIAHGRDWTKPGFRVVAVHRFGVWQMKIEPKLLRSPFSILYKMMFRKVRNNYGIEIPYTVQLGRRVVAKFGSEAFLPLNYFRLLRESKIDTWLVAHQRW